MPVYGSALRTDLKHQPMQNRLPSSRNTPPLLLLAAGSLTTTCLVSPLFLRCTLGLLPATATAAEQVHGIATFWNLV